MTTHQRISRERWRVGRKLKINVYEGDRPVCQCHTSEDAARIVQALNDVEELAADRERLTKALSALMHEASGFVGMADPSTHGITNIRVLERKIAEAWETLGFPEREAIDQARAQLARGKGE